MSVSVPSLTEDKKCACGSCVYHKTIDEQTGFEISDDFERFNQKYDVFNRANWDETVRSERVQKFFESCFTDLAQFRKVEGLKRFHRQNHPMNNMVFPV